jgi:hypothetical protein
MITEKIDTCENLELIPLEGDREMVIGLLQKYNKSNEPEEWKEYYIEKLSHRAYEPHCKKKRCTCVVVESHIGSQRAYGFGNFHQQFKLTKINSPRIKECSVRKIPKGNKDGTESLETFLLTHIKAD